MGTINTFDSLKPDLKDTYSDSGKKFKKLRKTMKSRGKATAEEIASRDPMAALKDKSYLNLKGRKGIAV